MMADDREMVGQYILVLWVSLGPCPVTPTRWLYGQAPKLYFPLSSTQREDALKT